MADAREVLQQTVSAIRSPHRQSQAFRQRVAACGQSNEATTIVLAAEAALVTGELVERPLLPPPNTTPSNHRHLAELPVYRGIAESARSRITGVAEPRPDDA